MFASDDDSLQTELRNNPYPGLRPFLMHEADLFFGRDEQRMELLKRLRQSRFLAVVGNSGSGKSSLVRAGLLPGLYGGFMDRSGTHWHIADTRPGGDPIGRLAAALDKPGVLSEEGMQEGELSFTDVNLRRSALGLVEIFKEARLPENERLLILVDQFEELFRFVDETVQTTNVANDAAAFVKLLLAATQQTDVLIYVVLTMRTDYLGDCARFRDLPEAINDGQYLVPRLTRSQRREAIVGPAAVYGVSLSPTLLNRLLNDVGDVPDHLPILQHALMRTWDHWKQTDLDETEIKLQHYEQIGGMSEALLRHAESIFNGLAKQVDEKEGILRKHIAEKLFKCLTQESDTGQQVRRLATLQEIANIAEAEIMAVTWVINAFRQSDNSFLMPPRAEELCPDTYIDISHESLIRNWETLGKWAHQEAHSADSYKRLAHTAGLYQLKKEDLLEGQRLRSALQWKSLQQPNQAWAMRYDSRYDQTMEFLNKSEIKTLAADGAIANKRRIKISFFAASVVAIAILLLLFVLDNVETIIENEQQRDADLLLTEVYELWLRPLYPITGENPANSNNETGQLPQQERHKLANKIINNLVNHPSENHSQLAAKLSLDQHGKDDIFLLGVLTGPDSKGDFEKLQRQFSGNIRTKIAKSYVSRQFRPGKSIKDLFIISLDKFPKEMQTSLEFFSVFFPLLIFGLPLPIWRWFTLSRWKPKDKVKARPNPLWRIFASLIDLAVACSLGVCLGAIVGMIFHIIESFHTLTYKSGDDAVVIALWVGIPVAMTYWLLRDFIKYRYRRSIGKIIFGLCPMKMTDEPINLMTSVKYNSFSMSAIYAPLAISPPFLMFLLLYFFIDSFFWVTFLIIVCFILFSPIVWLIFALKGEGRTLGDRFAKVRIVDVRSEEAQLLEIKSLAEHSTKNLKINETEWALQ